jgi:type III restriction enzyme
VKIELKQFQETTSQMLVKQAAAAANEVAQGGAAQALVLSAPTGSGKTVIAAALMETILKGDEDNPGNPNATFLWITDQPELNEQTRRKFEACSDVFSGDQNLVTVEASSFDQATFDAGKVYFLNTQKLGKKSSLAISGDQRKHTIWETIANTVAEKPGDFWLVIDEAQRGMNENRSTKEAASLVQKLIKGAEDVQVPPVPLIFGVSATPERFDELLKGTDRTRRSQSVDAADVRISGLLKDLIRLYHPDEDQPSDLSLLADAAERLKAYGEGWSKYAKDEDTVEVRPILVVQVEDGTKNVLTKTPLEDVLTTLDGVLGKLTSSDIAQCFEDGTPIEVSGLRIPYIAPSDIQDSNIRVVLFKMALTTGWDCPRAEVMMSFRGAKDQTLIAQLVGRMVRTPLARRVSGNDLLNTVALYLPYYDKKQLKSIIDKLSEPDPDGGIPGTDVEDGNNFVELQRDPDRQAAFAAADGLPNYTVERVSKQSGARRLLRLGRRLSWDGIDEDAHDNFTEQLMETLDAEYKRDKGDPKFKKRLDEAGRIDVRVVVHAPGDDSDDQAITESIPVVEKNIEHAFAEAGRKLGGGKSGIHNSWAKRRASKEGADKLPLIKRETYALSQDEKVIAAIEKKAEDLCREALKEHQDAIAELPDDKQDEYRRLRRQAAAPIAEPWQLPGEIDGPKDGDDFDKHLYIKKDGGAYVFSPNSWEASVLKDEIAKDEVVGWLRNDPRKQWSFCIPFEVGGEERPMYPDFLIFRKQGKKVVCDILEPHSLSFADSSAKAIGLSKFAKAHGEKFGRIELIAKTGGDSLKRLDVNDPDTQKKVLSAKTNDHLKQLVDGL